ESCSGHETWWSLRSLAVGPTLMAGPQPPASQGSTGAAHALQMAVGTEEHRGRLSSVLVWLVLVAAAVTAGWIVLDVVLPLG
ncbi:MAG: hypothetical protein QOC59_1384, partial [Microbacteriaceae bacterium]|nr:hypothetical protein [Microbacteriaceae bacterium]